MIGGSSPGRGWKIFSSPPYPDRLWDPPSLLSNEYRGLSPWRYSGRFVKLTAHLHLVPRSMRGAIPPLPQYASMAWGSVKSTGTTLTVPLKLKNIGHFSYVSISTNQAFKKIYSLFRITNIFQSRDSSVGIALGYGLDDQGSRGSIPGGGWEFFSSPRPERFWGPLSLLSNR
jgi:hypothetical protein